MEGYQTFETFDNAREHTASERIDLLRIYLEYEYLYPSYDDPYHSACAGALSDLLSQPEIHAVYTSYLEHRAKYRPDEHLSTWALERLSTTAIFMCAWERLQNSYEITYPGKTLPKLPENFKIIETWKREIEELHSQKNSFTPEHIDHLLVMQSADLNTIKIGRGIPIKFVLMGAADRWDYPPRILDVGCSRNDLLLMIAMNKLNTTATLTGTPDDELYTSKLNETLTATPSKMGIMTGIDIHPYPDDLIYGKWFLANTLRFSKRNDSELVAHFEELGSEELRKAYNVVQLSADFTQTKIETMAKRGYPKKLENEYEIVVSSFVTYMLKSKSREIFINHCQKFLSRNGLHILTDTVEIDPANPQNLIFPDTDKGGSSTVVFDKSHPELGYQKLFSWKNGECVAGSIGKSRLSKELWSKILGTEIDLNIN